MTSPRDGEDERTASRRDGDAARGDDRGVARGERRLPAGTSARLIAAFALLALALLTRNGDGAIGLPLVLLALALVIDAVIRPRARATPPGWLGAVVLLLAAGSLTRPAGNQLAEGARLPLALSSGVIAAAALVAGVRPRLAGAATALMLATYLAAGIALVRASPQPRIDVFVIEQEGARELLAGRDPYRAQFSNPYDATETSRFFGDQRTTLREYPYPPLSLLATTLGYAALGDVRWALLAAQLAAAAGLWSLARQRGRTGAWPATLVALHLGHPRGLLVLEQAWTEPLVAAALVGSLVALGRGGRRLAVGLTLGAVLAVKQYSLLLMPLYLGHRATVPRRAWPIALAAAATVTLPFAVWGWHGFVDDVLLFQLRQPFRVEALSLPAVIALATGWRAPGALALFAAAVALGLAWRRLPSGRHGVALGGALVLLTLFVSAKQAFCNYYYLVGVLLLAAAATAPTEESE